MSRLDTARRLREAAEELEAAQVEAARKAGATWNEIGACYGAHQARRPAALPACPPPGHARDRGAKKHEGRPGGLTGKLRPGCDIHRVSP
jgi:hypothetical protein